MNIRPFVGEDAEAVAGLAKALLRRTFAEFWRRGTTRATLDVDAQNETGAVRLYERGGMHVEPCAVAFEKAIA